MQINPGKYKEPVTFIIVNNSWQNCEVPFLKPQYLDVANLPNPRMITVETDVYIYNENYGDISKLYSVFKTSQRIGLIRHIIKGPMDYILSDVFIKKESEGNTFPTIHLSADFKGNFAEFSNEVDVDFMTTLTVEVPARKTVEIQLWPLNEKDEKQTAPATPTPKQAMEEKAWEKEKFVLYEVINSKEKFRSLKLIAGVASAWEVVNALFDLIQKNKSCVLIRERKPEFVDSPVLDYVEINGPDFKMPEDFFD